MFKKGDTVAQIVPPPIVGQVASFAVDQETGSVQILVEWSDADGVVHSRYFGESEVQIDN